MIAVGTRIEAGPKHGVVMIAENQVLNRGRIFGHIRRRWFRRVEVSGISITFGRCVTVVEMRRDSGTPEAARYLLAELCRIGILIKVQAIDDTNEDRLPVPAHESGTGK